jgi:hypothetical protein
MGAAMADTSFEDSSLQPPAVSDPGPDPDSAAQNTADSNGFITDSSAASEDEAFHTKVLAVSESFSSYSGWSRLPGRLEGVTKNTFVFSPRLDQWTAYDSDGYAVASGHGNGGADYCAQLGKACHTPVGVFNVYRKGDSSCASSEFPLGQGGAPMPFCMFFSNGSAIHGSPYVSDYNTSHGCIRVVTPAAQWLSSHFMQVGTRVVVLPY